MSTPATIQRAAIAGLLLIGQHATVSAATEHALYIDGKVRTDGVAFDGTRVLVERDGTMVRMLDEDIGRFHMRLDLQRVYILSFEREGCLTKKLLFDTHVPEESLDNGPFAFPFKVTLEKNADSEVLHYTQPVGFIRYFQDKHDFRYDTNYRMRRDEMPAEQRLARVMPPSNEAPTPVTRTQEPASIVLAAEPETRDASTVSMMPRSAEVMSIPATIPATSEIPVPMPEPAHGPMGTTMMHPVPRAAKATTPERATTPPTVAPRSIGVRVIHVPRGEAPPPPDGRIEEVQVEPTYVARTVRITKDGRTHEYRRVTLRYGEVFYFCKGSSCSAASYSAGIRE